MSKIKVGIIGGTGYTGVELLRLLVNHDSVELNVISSRGEAGKAVADIFPSLRGHTDIAFTHPSDSAFDSCDVVFSATPNGIAMQHAPALLAKGIKFIDLAADFRITDVSVWEQWYGMRHHCPELIESAVYGLPELNREKIKQSNLVANPGCYPTASTLALAPLVSSGLIDNSQIIIDAKSGVSGAGRGASVANLYSEVADSFKAYGASGHRHQPEISQNLSNLINERIEITFVPHLVPMLRGIHATVYAQLNDHDVILQDIHALFESSYLNEPFVDVLPLGLHPDTRSVKSSNMCRIAVHQAAGTNKLVVLSTIDNLTKGAAGQAIQNMNLMFGLDEALGLMSAPILP